ncbi:MAG: type II secretion system GspH family protein [Gammaproteobacteria bacterium]|nr:type II secretion system GspH family protein [Gammaproteobacteria bacterium]
MTKSLTQQQGVTLLELVVVIAILAVAMVGVATGISAAISRTSDVMVETRAVALAQSYLDEILGKRFDENSAPRGIPPCRSNCTDEVDFGLDDVESARDDFDDVDDYHGLDEGDEQPSPLQDAEGNDRSGYENYRVSISVRYLEPCGAEALLVNLADEVCNPADETEELAAIPFIEAASVLAKVITVTVRHRDNDDGWPFTVYKSNF